MIYEAYRQSAKMTFAALPDPAFVPTSHLPPRNRLAVSLAASLAMTLAIASGAVAAQAYPTTVIRMISGVQPGSMPDVIARMVAEKLSVNLGRQVIVEPRPGAAGLTGGQAVARSTPDGHWIGVYTDSDTLAPLLNPGTVDPKELAPVATMATVPMALTVTMGKSYKTLADLVADARAYPGKLVSSSAGFVTATHLGLERFRISAKLNILHVPSKGAPGAIAELLADRVDMYFSPIPGSLPLLKSGKLRLLAMSSAKRTALFPDVPTTLELGYPDSDYNFWIGISAPVKTPRAIVQRINKEARSAVTSAEMLDKFLNIGAEPLAMGVPEFEAMVHELLESNAVLIKTKGFRPE